MYIHTLRSIKEAKTRNELMNIVSVWLQEMPYVVSNAVDRFSIFNAAEVLTNQPDAQKVILAAKEKYFKLK